MLSRGVPGSQSLLALKVLERGQNRRLVDAATTTRTQSTVLTPFPQRFSRAVRLRWGDAGAEGLRTVLPAVDLLDGSDKDPFAGRRHAKPGGVERVNVSRFTGLLRQDPKKRVMVHIGHPGVLRALKCQSSLLALASGGFLFSGSCPINAARTLAVSPAKSGATGSWRPGKMRLCSTPCASGNCGR